MWLMVFNNTLYTCLVLTTVCVTVFRALVSWRLDSHKEVMSATSAYAVVLAVFVRLALENRATIGSAS